MNIILASLKFILSHPLNRKNQIAAILRILRWQLGTRLLPFPCAIPFVDDTVLLTSRSMMGATGNFYCGLHEFSEMGFVLHCLRPDDLFVDIGANVGSYSLLAGGVKAKVIAVEPVPDTFQTLQKNVSVNLLSKQVDCVNIGLGESVGYLLMTTDFDTMNYVLTTDTSKNYMEIPSTTLDELCAKRLPTLIKIDVEGYEYQIVSGGKKTLASPSCKAVIIETNDSGLRYGWDNTELVSILQELGFVICSYDPLERNITPASLGKNNTIFIKENFLSEMQERCKTARRFRLVNGDI